MERESALECFADEKALAKKCSDIQVSQQVGECISKQYEISDKNLNDTYKQVLKKIDEDYKVDPKLGGELRDLLKKAQLSWIKFRDSNCEMKSFEVENGKPAKSTLLNRCLMQMTQERISELNGML